MAEHDHGATAREYWRSIDARDWDGLRAVLAPDVVYRVPQTGEQAIGPERSVRFNAEYPGDWRLSVTTLVADAEGAATTIDFVDGDEHQTGIALFTFAPDGRIATIDDWWPEPYEPPPGREHLLDRPDA